MRGTEVIDIGIGGMLWDIAVAAVAAMTAIRIAEMFDQGYCYLGNILTG